MRMWKPFYLALVAILYITNVSGQARPSNIPGPEVYGLPVLILAAGVLFVVMVTVLGYILHRRSSENPEQRLEELVNQIKNELSEGQKIKDSHVSEEIEMAEEAVEKGNYERAANVMDEIETKIE